MRNGGFVHRQVCTDRFADPPAARGRLSDASYSSPLWSSKAEARRTNDLCSGSSAAFAGHTWRLSGPTRVSTLVADARRLAEHWA
eukprot:7370747-Prymnesium_polylepis.1